MGVTPYVAASTAKFDYIARLAQLPVKRVRTRACGRLTRLWQVGKMTDDGLQNTFPL